MKDIKLGLVLSPVWWDELPEYRVDFNGVQIAGGFLNKTTTFDWKLPALDKNTLSVHFLNKKDSDTQGDKDKAIVIDKIIIEDFDFYSFIAAGRYTPQYPDGYYRYAKEHNLTVEAVLTQNYLSFNGEWQLNIDWPVFSWIHQTENLGWLHEVNI